MSEITTKELTKPEAALLATCEKTIERGINTFVEVGEALAEIRNSKLYRASHKTFEAYCDGKWKFTRQRAYQLIDQAKVVRAVADAAGSDLSTVVDKINEHKARQIKSDLPTMTAQIRSRVEQGEAPAKTVSDVVSETLTEKQARGKNPDAEISDDEWKRQQDGIKAGYSKELQAHVAAQDAAKAARKSKRADADLSGAGRIEELEMEVIALENENGALKAKLKTFERLELMFKDWTEGGWDRVVEAKDQTIAELQRTAQARIAQESSEKVRNLNAMRGLARKLDKAGKGRDVFLDLDEPKNG